MDMITLVVLTGFHSNTHSFQQGNCQIVTIVLAAIKDKTELLKKHLASC